MLYQSSLALSPTAAANRRIWLAKYKPEITPLSIPTNFAPLPDAGAVTLPFRLGVDCTTARLPWDIVGTREEAPFGTITLAKRERGRFTDKQVELVITFADQAVIAIENARLFEAEQTSKCGHQESLQYQTAISNVLSVISRSPNELQPVLDTIARIASRPCAADDVIILLNESGDLRTAAHHGSIALDPNLKLAIGRASIAARTVMNRQPVHVHDITATGDEFPLSRELGAASVQGRC